MFDGVDHTVQALYVSPFEFRRWADRVRPALEKMAAGSDGRYEAVDIASAIAVGNMLLWVAFDGADMVCVMVTEIARYPRVKAMRCVGIVGHRPRRWMHLLADIERAARECFGCTRIEAFVAPGHERLLQTGGWSLEHSLWGKAL